MNQKTKTWLIARKFARKSGFRIISREQEL